MIYLIRRFWTDFLENDVHSARGYETIGYVESEEEAKSICDNSPLYTGKCWAVDPNEQIRCLKYVAIPKYTA